MVSATSWEQYSIYYHFYLPGQVDFGGGLGDSFFLMFQHSGCHLSRLSNLFCLGTLGGSVRHFHVSALLQQYCGQLKTRTR